jgi:exopolysaccharide biosynthesis polyprenyl glycosylphosphotransferase
MAVERSALATETLGAAPSQSSIISTGWGDRDYTLRRALALADILALVAALFLTSAFLVEDQPRFDLALAALPMVPVLLGLFKVYGLYDRDVKRISHTSLDDVPWLFHALVVGTLFLWAYCKLTGFHHLAFPEAAVFGVSSLVLVCAGRAVARSAVRRRLGPERVLFVGWDSSSELVLRRLGGDPDSELELVGIVGAGEIPGADESFPPILGPLVGLPEVLARIKPDRVLVSRSELNEAELLDLLHTCRTLSTKISVLPGAIEAIGPAVELDEVSGVALLGLSPPVLGRTSRWLKRGLDISISALMLLIAAPLMLLIALAVRIDSGSPVFFRQRRIGKGGRAFDLIKFRTMVCGAEQRHAELMAQSRDPNWLDLEHDPRVTRVGRLLRKTSLDEIPQLVNVLAGQMSLVGPRPLPEPEDRRVSGWGRGRLDLTPGITGLWQVRGRNRLPFEEMVKLDYLYVTNWSLWMDVRLLLRTAPAVIARRGAK